MMSFPSDDQSIVKNGWFHTRWKRLLLAVTFLTRLPLPVRGEVTPDDLRASMAWYPLIGLALGGMGWGIFAGSRRLFPGELLSAVLTIVLLEMCTGALHLDGFMDTCDGLGSGAPRERALEIMKDSRVGAMGVFGAIALLLLKIAAMAALAPAQARLPLLLGMMGARAIPPLDVSWFRYARAQGTAGAFTHGKAPAMLPLALASVLVAAWLIGQWTALVLIVVALGLTLLVQLRIAKLLGGLTGDVYGMGIELTETFMLLLGCILAKWTFISFVMGSR